MNKYIFNPKIEYGGHIIELLDIDCPSNILKVITCRDHTIKVRNLTSNSVSELYIHETWQDRLVLYADKENRETYRAIPFVVKAETKQLNPHIKEGCVIKIEGSIHWELVNRITEEGITTVTPRYPSFYQNSASSKNHTLTLVDKSGLIHTDIHMWQSNS